MKQPKPIDVSNMEPVGRIDHERVPVKLVPIPEREEKGILEKIGDRLPYFILRYGQSSIKKLVDYLPGPLGFILKWTGKGISWAAKRYSVEQK